MCRRGNIRCRTPPDRHGRSHKPPDYIRFAFGGASIRSSPPAKLPSIQLVANGSSPNPFERRANSVPADLGPMTAHGKQKLSEGRLLSITFFDAWGQAVHTISATRTD
jgi:hypothetical protein